MNRAFLVLAAGCIVALLVACGGAASRTGGIILPARDSVVAVTGMRLASAAAFAEDYDDLAAFVANIGKAPDISRNLVRSGNVKLVKNGCRVLILEGEMMPGAALVRVLDGDYAGLCGYMDYAECGAKRKPTDAPASGQPVKE